MTPIFDALAAALDDRAPVALATIIDGAGAGAKLLVGPGRAPLGSLGDAILDAAATAAALARLDRAEPGIETFGAHQVFIETYPAPATLFIVGAVHIAIPLVTFAKTLGLRTVVIDARGTFATPERFVHADELVHAWPDEALDGRLTTTSAVVLLTHDPKLDDPALHVALPSQAMYIGALGSAKTHAARVERLRAAGIPEPQIARLHAPIGLRIGAKSPEEIAVSIIAEIVAVRHRPR